MDIQHLPIIDWELAMRLTGNKREIAEEIHAMLIKHLPKDMSAINQHYEQQQYKELNSQLHKLHGALCYCGLPRLKALIAKLEYNVKNDQLNDLPMLMKTLNEEVALVMEQAA